MNAPGDNDQPVKVHDQESADTRADRYILEIREPTDSYAKITYGCEYEGCLSRQRNPVKSCSRPALRDHVDVVHFGEYRFLRVGKICDMCDLYASTTRAIKEHQQAVHVRKARTALNHCSQCNSVWSTIQGLKHHQSFDCPERKDPRTGKRAKSRVEKRRWDGEKRCYIYKLGSNPERLIAEPMNGGSFIFESSDFDDSEGPDMSSEEVAKHLAHLQQQLDATQASPKLFTRNLTHIENLKKEIHDLQDATQPSSKKGSPWASSAKSLSKSSPTLTARQRIVYGSPPSEL